MKRITKRSIQFLTDTPTSVIVTELIRGRFQPKWHSVTYQLPDGSQHQWWQPYKPVHYKAIDLTYDRARRSIARKLAAAASKATRR